MKKLRSFFLAFIAFTASTISFGQNTKPVTDYLKVPGPIVLAKKSYNLSWSSHPSANYYKHEYLVKGDNADRFQTMIMLEVVTSNSVLKDIVGAKVAELKKMKETNPMVNYEMFENAKAGEYMLDFLLSANGADGNMNVVERNVYRYKTFTTKSGQTGLMLFGVSTRSYGNNITPFLTSLKTNKKDLVNEVSAYKLPEIKM